MKFRTSIIVSAILAISIGIGGGVWYYNYATTLNEELDTHVLPNTTFDGVSLAGKTKEQVQQIVDEKVRELESKNVKFVLNGQEKDFTWKDLGVGYEGKDVAERVFQEQEGKVLERRQMKEEASNATRKKEFTLTQVISTEKYDEVMKDHYNDNLEQPKDATIYIDGIKIITTPSKNGKGIDKEQLQGLAMAAIKEQKDIVDVPVKEIAPKKTTEDVKNMGLDGVIMEYRSPLKGREGNTRFNVDLAAKGIDGTMLAPGDVFSFQQVVGKANKANGYKESTVYINGEIGTDYGGGICQVSSTLYNAVLLADLSIVNRINHSRTVGYVPIGLDATVADDGPDFKFKNSMDTYVYVQSFLTNDELVVRLFGRPTGKQVVLSSKVDSETDTAIKASAYKTITQNGKVIANNVLIGRSTYKKG